MINRTVLTGRLTKDIELRFTQSGKPVTNFILAVDRSFTNRQGEREADFISCSAWGKTAENISKFFRKGSLIGIDGRLQTRNYENQQGQRVYVTEVMIESFAFLERKSTDQRSQPQLPPEPPTRQQRPWDADDPNNPNNPF